MESSREEFSRNRRRWPGIHLRGDGQQEPIVLGERYALALGHRGCRARVRSGVRHPEGARAPRPQYQEDTAIRGPAETSVLRIARQQSGQASPIPRITSSRAARQASGVTPGNGFRHASSRARFQASGSARSRAMAVVLAFHDRALLDQGSERPALQRAVRGAGGVEGQLALRIGRHGGISNQLDRRSIASRASSFA